MKIDEIDKVLRDLSASDRVSKKETEAIIEVLKGLDSWFSRHDNIKREKIITGGAKRKPIGSADRLYSNRYCSIGFDEKSGVRYQYHIIKGIKYIVFASKEDCWKMLGNDIEIHDWRNAKEGQWVEADDGGVTQIIKISTNKDNIPFLVRTIVGSFDIRKGKNGKPYMLMDTDFSWREYPGGRYSLGGSFTSPSIRLKRKNKASKKEEQLGFMIATGQDPVEAYRSLYKQKIDARVIKQRIALLMKQEWFMGIVRQEVLDAAKRHGINEDYVISRLKKLSEVTEDEDIEFKTIKEMGNIIGLNEKEKITNGTIVAGQFQGFTNKKLVEGRKASKYLEEAEEVK